MSLNFKKLGEGEPLIILHGLMGMLDNWQTQAKVLAEHYEVYIVDQRNHGRSFHNNVLTYQALADDLFDFVYEHHLVDVNIIGHSMGGKVAMKFAQSHPQMINKLIVADMAPRSYPVHHRQLLDVLTSIQLENKSSRSEVFREMEDRIENKAIIQFLLKNLYWVEKGKLAWRFNLPVIDRDIAQMGEAVKDAIYEGEVLFIGGAKSDYIKRQDQEDLDQYFPNHQLKMIDNAGHWVHADNTPLFLEYCLEFLD